MSNEHDPGGSARVFSLRGKRFIVTGGTGGIGRAIVLQFARADATVIANYAHREEAALSLTEGAALEGLDVRVVRADVTTERGRARILDGLPDGDLSGLVHCAATGVHEPIEKLTGRHFDFTFALNVRALVELVQLLLPRLSAGASVVALSSEGAVRAIPRYTVVGASKGALEALCRHLAVELAPRGIRVNVLSPGSVPTPAWNAFPDGARRLEEAARRAPSGRLVTPEEVACAAHFLCSEAASGVTGQVLVVDGGARISGETPR